MESPLVSVITTSYLGINYLKNCSVPSLILQDYKNFECLVVCDGEDAEVRMFLESLSDSRFRYLDHPKAIYAPEETWAVGGAVGANLALSVAQGKYQAHLDQDDLWSPRFLEKNVEFMESHSEVDFVHSRFWTTSEYLLPVMPYRGSKVFNPIAHLTAFYRGPLRSYRYVESGTVASDFNRWQRMYHAGVQMKNLPMIEAIYNDKKKSFDQVRALYEKKFQVVLSQLSG